MTNVSKYETIMSMAERAKTIEQKKQVMRRLQRLWFQNPDMRLSQLLENVFHHADDNHCFYFIEDFPLLEALENHYNAEIKTLKN